MALYTGNLPPPKQSCVMAMPHADRERIPKSNILVLFFILLTILIAATPYPWTVLGMREANSGSGLFTKIAA